MGNGLEIGSRWMGKISPELEKLEEMITREAQFNQIFKAPDHRKTKYFNCLTKWPPWKSSAWSRSNLERKHGKMFHITWCGDFGRNVSLNKFIDRILHVKKRSDSAANWLQEMEQGKWNSSHQTKKNWWKWRALHLVGTWSCFVSVGVINPRLKWLVRLSAIKWKTKRKPPLFRMFQTGNSPASKISERLHPLKLHHLRPVRLTQSIRQKETEAKTRTWRPYRFLSPQSPTIELRGENFRKIKCFNPWMLPTRGKVETVSVLLHLCTFSLTLSDRCMFNWSQVSLIAS